MVTDGSYGQLAPCPRCGYGDSLLSVPAAYAAARSTEAAVRVVRDDKVTSASRDAARATVNAALPIVLANELAMVPNLAVPELGCGLLFFGVVAVGTFVVSQLAAGDPIGDIFFLVAGVVAVLLSVFFTVRLSLALARRQRIQTGKPAAEAIWRLGWYCCRCAVVHFRAGEEPAGVIPGQTLTPSQFTQIVWTAGRYGKAT